MGFTRHRMATWQFAIDAFLVTVLAVDAVLILWALLVLK